MHTELPITIGHDGDVAEEVLDELFEDAEELVATCERCGLTWVVINIGDFSEVQS